MHARIITKGKLKGNDRLEMAKKKREREVSFSILDEREKKREKIVERERAKFT